MTINDDDGDDSAGMEEDLSQVMKRSAVVSTCGCHAVCSNIVPLT